MLQIMHRLQFSVCLFALLLTALPALSQPMLQKVAENHELQWTEEGDFALGSYTVTEEEQKSWESLYPFVTRLISDDLIASLSVHAIEETKKFHFVPGHPGSLGVLGFNDNYVVYEATLAQLPAPPSLLRQLKVLLVSPNMDHQLLPNKIIMTIRSQTIQ